MKTETQFTLKEFLENAAQLYADNTALLAHKRAPLTYRGLLDHTVTVTAQLIQAGFQRGDRIAIVVPDGAELALTILSLSTVVTTACLKTTLTTDEYSDVFSRLHFDAVVLDANAQGSAREVALRLGLHILELTPRVNEAAGLFDLVIPGKDHNRVAETKYATIDDIAWLGLTSGTTDRPKVVPMTHKNVWNRIGPRTEVLTLTENDRWLALTPLTNTAEVFHCLGMLSVGGSLIIPPSFDVTQFFDYLDTFKPTYIGAPASMYQSILANAANRGRSLAGTSLRLVRSGSMSLPLTLLHEMEQAFKVPVLQSYGMRETGSIAINPLPPAQNKPGSVGIATGQEVQIMDDHGHPLTVGAIGEIVVRGPGVISGYEGDPEATRKAFFGEWFRTGDQGYLDEDSYLFITGRIKDLINRGGEKISPTQVENVLLMHPSIGQAVVFPVPDPRLGENVVAAVVLRTKEQVTEKDLRDFVGQHLAAAKVPQRILFVADIPTTDVGKWQRASLAEKFGVTANALQQEVDSPTPYVAPRSPLEAQIADLWTQVLGVPTISINAEFLDMGGDSLTATRLIGRLRRTLQIEISLLDFFDAPTIAQQAEVVNRLLST